MYFRAVIAALVFLMAGSWFLLVKRTPGLQRFDLLVGWAAKLLACGVFLYIYTYYYGGGSLTADPEEFMKESGILAEVAHHSLGNYLKFMFGLESEQMVLQQIAETTHWSSGDLMLMNDSKNVIRFNSVLYFFSGGNVWAHCIVFAFISLLGFRELYLTFYKYVAERSRSFWFGLILLPSVIFWTSGMLKEPLMIVGMCLLCRGLFDELSVRGKVVRLILGVLLMLCFKPYVFFCLLPAIIWYLIAIRLKKRLRTALFVSIPVAVPLLIAVLPAQRELVASHLTRKQFDFINVGRGGLHVYADTCFFYFRPDQYKYIDLDKIDSTAYLKTPIVAKMMTTGKTEPFDDVLLQPNSKPWIYYYDEYPSASFIKITEIRGSYGQLICNIPEALVNAAIRPFPGDPGGSMKYVAFVESVLLVSFLLYFCIRRWRRFPEKLGIQLSSLLLFAVFLLLLTGWTTPVLGAIVRYRIPAYLVFGLVVLLLAFLPQKRLKNHE